MNSTKRTVLLALTDAHHGFFKGAARYAREHHWHLVTDMIYTAKIPLGWNGDGIISFIGYREDLANYILTSKIPTVEISMVRCDLALPRVEGDNEMIGRLAAEHFIERGFRNYAWAPFMDDVVNTERHHGFGARLAQNGLTCHVLPAANSQGGGGSTLDWAQRRKILIRELRSLPKPLAVFGYNDCVAADIIDACEVAGLAVPESVAVLGVDNDTILCECLRVPLSSVCHDLEGMAYQAAALLDRMMKGCKPPKLPLRIVPGGVVTRRSTDILAVENLAVAKALRYIADAYADPKLSVNEIASAAGISRRPLEKAFRKHLNRTINEETLRLRIAKARELLGSTAITVAEIAAATGFDSPHHFYRCFRYRCGMTPRAYRRQQETHQPQSRVRSTK